MSLNPNQQRAVDARGHVMIVACPGSGKTHTLVERANRILSEDPNSRLCIVTFTRDAATELRDRVVRKLGEKVLPRIYSGTFHSLCLQQLEAFFPDGKRPFKIAADGITNVLMQKAWEAAVSHFRRAQVKFDQVKRGIEFSKANRGVIPSDANAEVIKFALETYQGQLEAQGLIDFGDIIEYTVRGMQSGTLPVLPVTHVLVDEFQDADAVQVDWVLGYVTAGANVTCVGDDDQAIYGFRHAKGYDGMQMFRERSNADLITLDTTYRCCKEVISHAARLIVNNSERVSKDIRTANPKPGTVDRLDYATVSDEIEDLASLLNSRNQGETAAVLARTKTVLGNVAMYFKNENIPYIGYSEESLWSQGAPWLMRALLTAAVGKDSTGITLALTTRGMSRESNRLALEAINAVGGKFDALLGKEKWTASLSAPQLAIWEGIRDEYAEIAGTAARGGAMSFVDASLRFIGPGLEALSSDGLLKTLRAVLSKMPPTIAGMHGTLEARLRNEENGDQKKNNDPRAIVLMTLHASKGLEFDHVWMPAMRQGVLPHGNTSDVAEERRLCYVGLTRARQHLTVSYSRTASNAESIFLSEMGLPGNKVAARA